MSAFRLLTPVTFGEWTAGSHGAKTLVDVVSETGNLLVDAVSEFGKSARVDSRNSSN
jgi:hypothetical protein